MDVELALGIEVGAGEEASASGEGELGPSAAEQVACGLEHLRVLTDGGVLVEGDAENTPFADALDPVLRFGKHQAERASFFVDRCAAPDYQSISSQFDVAPGALPVPRGELSAARQHEQPASRFAEDEARTDLHVSAREGGGGSRGGLEVHSARPMLGEGRDEDFGVEQRVARAEPLPYDGLVAAGGGGGGPPPPAPGGGE